MHRLNSLAAWLRIPHSSCLAADRSDDKSRSLLEVAFAVRFSGQQKQTVWPNPYPATEHCDRRRQGVFDVENALQTR